MLKKILIIDTVHPLIPEELENAGYRCDQFTGYGRDQLMAVAKDYHGIIIRSGIVLDREFLEHAANLEFIGRVGSGMENVDTAYAESRGIRCLNSPEGNRDAVGEHTTGLLLALLNNMVRADRQIREGSWIREENRGTELGGKTVGIIGYGHMGSAFARRLQGFGCEVISYDKYKTGYSDGFTREVQMEEVYASADIISLHVPLTDETTGLVNAEFISRVENPFYLLNTSRGKVVRSSDLVDGLKTGKILGAALDVLEYEDNTFEKLAAADSPDLRFLRDAGNVIMTPHIAGWTRESNIRLARVLVEKILKNQ